MMLFVVGMSRHRRNRHRAPEIVDLPQDLADDPPMTTMPDTGIQPVVEDVVLDDPFEREITRPYPRATQPMPFLVSPPRH